MKRLVNKIIWFSGIFVIIAIIIGSIAYDQASSYQLQSDLEKRPEFICGNESTSSKKSTMGEAIFKANCVACHKIYKDAYGPDLQRFISRNDSITIAYLSNYFKRQRELNPLKRSYNDVVNDSNSTPFVHQKYPDETEIIQLVEYISE